MLFTARQTSTTTRTSARAGANSGPVANASWQVEASRMRDRFDRVDLHGDVHELELAAGTGAWTERIVGRARSLTVIDGSAEMLKKEPGSARAACDTA